LRCENSNVPGDYDVGFKKAEYTFLYQLVFDPRSQKQVRLNELPDGIDPSEFEFAGVYPIIM
jgi:exonuclease-1